MLLFAHAGITLGVVLGFDQGVNRLGPRLRRHRENAADRPSGRIIPPIDYRLVLVGSLLPDIIDKPLGHYFLASTFHHDGRIIAHTLLFFLLLLSIGLFRLWRGRHIGMLVLALASGGHLVLDRMWQTKETLLWPFYGWSFPASSDVSIWHWLRSLYNGLDARPSTFVPEIVGAAILVLLTLELLRRGALLRFLKQGRLA